MQLPSRKWVATQVTAVAAWLVAAINAGWSIDTELQIMAVGIVAQAIIGYVLPNADTEVAAPAPYKKR